jgi:hypothetical protein
MPALKVEDLLATEAGQAMVAEVEERQAAEQAAEEAERQENITVWTAERETLGSLYCELRNAVVDKVEGLAGDTEALGKLLGRIRELDSFLQRAGADVPYSVRLTSKREVSNQVRAIAQRLVARL